MLKIDVLLILEQFFDRDEDNCAIIHMNDGSEIIVEKKPSFHSNIMSIILEDENIEKEKIIEECHIPYENILYIITTNFENIKLRLKNYR